MKWICKLLNFGGPCIQVKSWRTCHANKKGLGTNKQLLWRSKCSKLEETPTFVGFLFILKFNMEYILRLFLDYFRLLCIVIVILFILIHIFREKHIEILDWRAKTYGFQDLGLGGEDFLCNILFFSSSRLQNCKIQWWTLLIFFLVFFSSISISSRIIS